MHHPGNAPLGLGFTYFGASCSPNPKPRLDLYGALTLMVRLGALPGSQVNTSKVL